MCQGAPQGEQQAAAWAHDHALQVVLNEMNRRRLTPDRPGKPGASLPIADGLAPELEHQFIEQERLWVATQAAAAPLEARAFAAWFDGLKDAGPGQHDPLFDHLATEASLEQLRWFMQQEVAGEAGFDDLVALTQLRMPERAKLELARNYWDEMGHGKPAAMHGPMLSKLAQALDVPPFQADAVVAESLALCNLLVGLAYNRRYAYQALGALGVIELTAPTRAVKVVEAMDRLGVDRSASHYFRVHAVVDIAHAQTWRDEILIPLVEAQPEVATDIAEGALMRLTAGARTFERYRRELAQQGAALACAA